MVKRYWKRRFSAARWSKRRGGLICLFAIMAMLALSVPAAIPVAAAPGNMTWTGQPLPSSTSNVLKAGTDVTDIAVASDGNTIYVADASTPAVYRSDNGGQSFTRLTSYAGIGGGTPIAIAMAPDDPQVVAVADIDNTTVWTSTNSGTTWSNLGPLPTTWNAVDITDVAVGPVRAGTLLGREYAISVADPNTDNTNTGGGAVGDVVIIGKIATWASAAGTTGITGDMDYMAVAFSPNFVGDRCLVAVGASVGSGSYGAGVFLHLLNNAQGKQVLAPTALHSVATDYRTTGVDNSDIVCADIALPSDFDPSTGSGRRSYVGIGTAATFTNDDVYRIDNTESRALGGVSAQPLKSVAYSGTIDEGTLFIGQTNSNTIKKWSSNQQVSLPVWTISQQKPSGTNATIVHVPSDFATSDRVFAGTSGAESAFSVSDNAGVSFNAIGLNGTDVSDFAVAGDDTTIYAVDKQENKIYRSTDAGANWTELNNPPGATEPQLVATAPDAADTVAIVADDSEVYISTNGGTTWSSLGALPPTWASSNITDVAVGPARAGTLLGREYAVSVADPSNNATNTIGQQGDVLIIGKIATWASAAGVTGITGNMDYMAVAFSPNFVGDRCLVAVGASVGSGSYAAGVYFHLLNTAQGKQVLAPTAMHSVATDYVTTGTAADHIVAADIALPSDFDPSTGSGRRSYVGIGTAATYTNDDVYRIDNTESRALGAVSAQPIKSVAYSGNITDGTLFIGQNNSNTVKYSSNPQGPSSAWTSCKKKPGLAANTATVVRVAPDFATTSRVFAGTTGSESAFCVSNNAGVSFNAESLIDLHSSNTVVAVDSVRLTSDGSYLFVATDDGSELSLWKSSAPVSPTSWSRVYVVTATGPGLVRLNPDWADAPVVYLTDLTTNGVIYRSADGGDIFSTRASPTGTTILDMAVQDASTVYVGATTSVYRSTNGCWTWGLPKSAKAGVIASLHVAKEDHLIVGGTAICSYSTDGGTSFSKISSGLGAATYQVLGDDGYDGNNVIYAGGSNGNLYRFIIGESASWEDLANPTATGIVGLEMQSGTLYGMSASACDRNLNPTMAIGIVAATWDTMDAGYPTGVASFTVGAGSNVLYAANSTTTLWAYHDLFVTKPVLTSPANGASIPVDPVTGRAIPIALTWQPVGTGVGAGTRIDIHIKEKAWAWSPVPTVNNVSVSVTTPQVILTAEMLAANNFSLRANTQYDWRVRYDNQVSGDCVRTRWSDPFTFSVQAQEVEGVDISIQPAEKSVVVGETFNLVIQAEAGYEPVSGIQAFINFDPGYLEVQDADATAAGTQITPGSSLPEVLENSADNAAGTIDYRAARSGAPFPSGTFTVATIQFKALAETDPTTAITFSTTAPRETIADYGGNDVTGTITGGTDIVAYEYVPPPSEVWVDDDYTPAGYNDGHTWGYDAFAEIQDGIDAVAGSIVHVAAGYYVENITLADGVQVLGAGADVTTIDGGGAGSVVTAIGVSTGTVLDGFTITNGSGTDGGGMYNSNSSPTVTNCTFNGNSAGWGGGMYNWQSSPTVTNCTFSSNSASNGGGGMYNYDNTSPTITNCIFSKNSATWGGGMQNVSDSPPMVTNCIFHNNTATSWGGGMNNEESSPTITNCTFSSNSASTGGNGISNGGSSPTVTNCILWNNGDEIANDVTSTPLVTYSDIQGGYSGVGNIDADPLFVDPAGGNYHLQSSSPCIDAGTNEGAPTEDIEGNPRPIDGDGDTTAITDMGAYEYVPPTPQPPLPHAFYGNVLIDGNPAPAGTKVEVKGTGVITGIDGNPLYTTETGKYGASGPMGYKLIVQGYTLVNGTTLTFYVNDISTGQTFPFQSGNITELDLAVTTAGTTCSLTIDSTAGGSVVEPGEASPYTYNCTDEVDLLAVAENCYSFTGWTADSPEGFNAIGDASSANTSITMNGNYSITANFDSPPEVEDLEIPFHVGWNTFSTPISLHDCFDTWGEFITANELDVSMIYGYDAAAEEWVSVDDGDEIEPLYGFYVKTSAEGLAHIIPSANTTPEPTRELSRGVHLIGPAPASLEDIDVVSALESVYTVENGITGYTLVVSPYINSPNDWAYVRDAPDPPIMSIGRAYWLVMENAGELAGSSSTPLSP